MSKDEDKETNGQAKAPAAAGAAEHPADDQGGAGASPSAATVEDRLAAVERERDETKDRMLRIAAEFENWKKRARKEQEEGEAKVRESTLRDVLDVVDNLERAVSAYGQGATPSGGSAAPVDGAAVLKGVSLVLRLAQTKLERHGVKAIDTHGKPFDPRLHEAISRVETAEHPPGHVAVELQRGYMIGERLLRPAMVSVASAPAGTADGGGAGGPSGGAPGSPVEGGGA